MQVHERSDLHLTQGGLDLGRGLEQPDRIAPRSRASRTPARRRAASGRRSRRRDLPGRGSRRPAGRGRSARASTASASASRPARRSRTASTAWACRLSASARGPAGVVQGGAVAAARGVEPRHREERRTAPRLVPPRLAPRLVGLVRATGAREHLAEAEGRLAVAGVRVQTGLAGERCAQVLLGLGVLPGPVAPRGQRQVRAVVALVAPQGLEPVRLGRPGRVPVLVEVHADEVQLVDGRDVGGRRGLLRRLGHRRGAVRRAGSPRDDLGAAVLDDERQVLGSPGGVELARHARSDDPDPSPPRPATASRRRVRSGARRLPRGPASSRPRPARRWSPRPASRRGGRPPRGWPGGRDRSPGSGTSTG